MNYKSCNLTFLYKSNKNENLKVEVESFLHTFFSLLEMTKWNGSYVSINLNAMSYLEVRFRKLFVPLKYLISIFNKKVSDKTFFTCSNGKRKEIIYSFEKHKEGCVENAL